MRVQTQTPAPPGQTLTARAAPSPDSLDGAEEKGTFILLYLQWMNKITEENAMPRFKALVSLGFRVGVKLLLYSCCYREIRNGSVLFAFKTNNIHWSNAGKFCLG